MTDSILNHNWSFSEVRDPNCSLCDLHLHSPANKICLTGQGPRSTEWLFIGEAPGAREQEVEKPFSGPVGQYFDKILENVGIDRKLVYITNTCKCKPLHDDKPTMTQILACKKYLLQEIQIVRPKKILLIGDASVKAVIGKRKIGEIRGKVFHIDIEGLDYQPEVYPVYHPGYIRRNPKEYPVLYTDLVKFWNQKETSPNHKYIPIIDMETLYKVVKELLKSPEISYDYECESLDPFKESRLISVAISSRKGLSYCIPLDTELAPWTPQERLIVHRLVGAVLSNPKSHHIAYNSAFELKWSKFNGISAKCDEDPIVAAGLLDENLPHDLGTSIHLYVDPNWIKLDSSKITSWDWEKVYPYNCGDSDYTLRLSHSLRPKLLAERSSQVLYDKLLLPFQTKVLPKLELGGIYVHQDKLKEARERCLPERDKAYGEIVKHVPTDFVLPVKSKKSLKRGFNPGSPIQLSCLLYDYLQLPGPHGGSTAEPVLMGLKGKHPIIQPIMDFRGQEKLLDFLDSWEKLKDPSGFLHPHYHLIPVTGRLSCTDPNLQQVPRVVFIRKVLGAPPGYVLLAFDYSQIELRIIAHYSQDYEMIKAFLNQEDIHLLTASMMTSIPMEELRARIEAGDYEAKELRKKAKAINFGLAFGMGAFGLQEYARVKYEVDLTIEEAILWRDKFFQKHSKILLWHRKQIQLVHKERKVTSFIGRVRHLNNILSSDPDVIAEAERQAINCVDSETECLTAGGWKRYDQVKIEDLILTKDPRTRKLEWQPIERMNIFLDYKGPLVEFNSRSFSALTTLNHRWLIRKGTHNRWKGPTPFAFLTSGELLRSPKIHRIHRTGEYLGPVHSPYTDDEVELVGWVLTEGHYRKSHCVRSYFKKGRYNSQGHYIKAHWKKPRLMKTDAIVISQSQRANLEYVMEIDSLFSRLGIKPSRRVKRDTQCVYWTFYEELARKVRKACPDKKLTMKLLLSLTTNQLGILYETMMKGDGSGPLGRKYSSVDPELVDSFQVLTVLVSKSSGFHRHDQTGIVHRSSKLQNKEIPGVVSYRLDIHKREFAHSQSSRGRLHIKEVTNPGTTMWCPTVRNGTWVVRRKGQTYITGNSPVQGLASDLNLMSAVEVEKVLPPQDGWLAGLIHDCSLYIIREDRADYWRPKIKDIMEHPRLDLFTDEKFSVPIEVDSSVSKYWS